MARKRRRFTASFKGKLALEAVRGIKTISELAKKYKLHATQLNPWKNSSSTEPRMKALVHYYSR